jgi:hypothetical protein
MESLAKARPNMIATLDSFRDTLEDLGSGLGCHRSGFGSGYPGTQIMGLARATMGFRAKLSNNKDDTTELWLLSNEQWTKGRRVPRSLA